MVALMAVAAVNVRGSFTGPVAWSPDGYYYQAKVVQLEEGLNSQDALTRVMNEPAGRAAQAAERASHVVPRLSDPAWLRYCLPVFQNRWFVPVLAYLITPFSGERSLELVTLAGYLLCGPLLFVMLRQRASVLSSLVATIAALLIPPMTLAAEHPLTDTWGLLLEVAAVAVAFRVLQGPRAWRWLCLWTVLLAALALTREVNVVLILAAFCAAVFVRNRRSLWLAATGAVTALPSLLLSGFPFRAQIAFTIDGFQIPRDDSWSYIASHIPGAIAGELDADVLSPIMHADLATTGAVVLLAVGPAVAVWTSFRRRDPCAGFLLGLVVAGLLYLASSPGPSSLRLALVLLPAASLGFAMTLDSWRSWMSAAARPAARLR